MDARIEGGLAYLPLTRGKEAVIDAADLPRVEAAGHWYAHWDRHTRRWYARRRLGQGTLDLHRFLLDAGPEIVVSHVNGDGLDNRRENLRRWRKPKRRPPTPGSVVDLHVQGADRE